MNKPEPSKNPITEKANKKVLAYLKKNGFEYEIGTHKSGKPVAFIKGIDTLKLGELTYKMDREIVGNQVYLDIMK